MGSEENIATIQKTYEAFGRGDVDAILAILAEDVDWAAEAAGTEAPWYGVCRGPAEVAAFFTKFGTTMEVEDFTPISFAANESDVLTVVRFAAKSRSTGRHLAMHLHHFFRFKDGKVAYYRGTEDTAQTAATLRP